MGANVKIWMIVGACLIGLGCILIGVVMTKLNWDFTNLSTEKYETVEHIIGEDFHNISIRADTADIIVSLSEQEETLVVCHEQKSAAHTVSVQNGTLNIEEHDTRKWYEYIGFSFGTPSVTVYLPKTEYGELFIKENTGDIEIPADFQFESIDIFASTGDVTNCASAAGDIKIRTSTGKIHVENVSAENLSLSVSTGNITASGVACAGDVSLHVSTGKTNLTDITCKNLTSDGNTGDLTLNNVIGSELFSIERTTGDVTFESCDAAEFSVKTDTGDVTGSLLSDKIFFAETDTGSIHVPKLTAGGKCEITTNTGDITFSVG